YSGRPASMVGQEARVYNKARDQVRAGNVDIHQGRRQRNHLQIGYSRYMLVRHKGQAISCDRIRCCGDLHLVGLTQRTSWWGRSRGWLTSSPLVLSTCLDRALLESSFEAHNHW